MIYENKKNEKILYLFEKKELEGTDSNCAVNGVKVVGKRLKECLLFRENIFIALGTQKV